MIDQKNKLKNRKKNNSKTKKITLSNKFRASKSPLKSSRYSQKYLAKRNKYRKDILEKANADLKFELKKIQTIEQEEDQMSLEEINDCSEKKQKALKFNENPTLILFKNERYSARNPTLPIQNLRNMEQEILNLKSILNTASTNSLV